MPHIQEEYWTFYLDGRVYRTLKNDIDPGDLAARLMVPNGKSLRDTVMAASRAVAAPLESGKTKQRWIAEHDADIKAAGGDADAAFKAWLEGRVDELAYVLEPDVLAAMGEDDDDDDDRDEDDDEEEE
jgi:hypothetical protein